MMGKALASLALALGLALSAQAAGALKPIVVLDPGHGGAERGVKADGLEEAVYTLDFCQRIADGLKKNGYDARLTREQDVTLGSVSRTALARSLRARALVSIHINHSFNEQARGLRVFVPGTGAVDEPSAPLWEQSARLQAGASKALGQAIANALGDRNPKAVQSLKLALFRGLSVPAAQVELDYASNAEALATLKDKGKRDEMAAKIAQGITLYLRAGSGGERASQP